MKQPVGRSRLLRRFPAAPRRFAIFVCFGQQDRTRRPTLFNEEGRGVSLRRKYRSLLVQSENALDQRVEA